MPLKTYGNCKSKACKNKVIGENMHELKHFGKKPRSHEQMVAIALSAAGRNKKK